MMFIAFLDLMSWIDVERAGQVTWLDLTKIMTRLSQYESNKNKMKLLLATKFNTKYTLNYLQKQF